MATHNKSEVSPQSSTGDAIIFTRKQIDRRCRLVQLTAFILFIGVGVSESAKSSGLFHRICEFTADDIYPHQQVDCSNLNGTLNDAVVKANTRMNIYISLAGSIIPCLASLLLSAWGDRVGRKANVLLGMTGVQILILVQIIYLSLANPPYYLIPIVSVFLGFTGLQVIVATSIVQYVSDVEENRALMVVRCMLCSAAIRIGMVVGNAIAGAILKHQRFAVAMFIGQVIILIGIGMVMAVIEQRPPNAYVRKPKTESVATTEVTANQGNNQEIREQDQSLVAQVTELLQDIGRTYTRPREGRRRFVFWAILASLALASTGDTSFSPTFLQAAPLNFKPYQLSTYHAVSGAVIGVGSTLLSIGAYFVKIADVPLACISLASHFFSRFPIALADKKWEVYLSPVIGCCGYLFYGSYQAAITKIMSPEECGKGLAGEALGTTLATVVGDIVLNEVYLQTVSIYRSTAWFVSALLILLAFGSGMIAFWRSREIPELEFKDGFAARRKAIAQKKRKEEAADLSKQRV